MKIVYTENHLRHAPACEFTREGLIPYFESPLRAETIRQRLGQAGFESIPPEAYPLDPILAIHDPGYLGYLEHAYQAWVEAGEPAGGVMPITFALRHNARRPRDPLNQAGYYCFDTTPIVRGTWEAALAAAHGALTGAELLLGGERAAYALCRPPGHHAAGDLCGGYCYLNNAAIAASRLGGRVALLDIDYHHGNGTQEIFYGSDRVLFISLHGDPERAYPFFWGYADEQGAGQGEGCNHNFPLPAGTDDARYLEALDRALALIRGFAPDYLVLSAGFDLLGGDPLGDFAVSLEGVERIGARLAHLRLPTLVIQEGGYNLQNLGEAALRLLSPFA